MNLQRPYDGSNSTISRLAAGVVSPDIDLSLQSNQDYAGGEVRNDFKVMGDDAETAIWTGPNRRLGAMVADRSDVYWRSNKVFSSAIIIHEALHSLFGETDPELANRLDVTVTSNDTSAITKKLRENGCGK